jgi:hypothetical protein
MAESMNCQALGCCILATLGHFFSIVKSYTIGFGWFAEGLMHPADWYFTHKGDYLRVIAIDMEVLNFDH